MTQSEEIKLLVSTLFDKYGQVALDTKTTASLLGKAEISLKTDRMNGTGLPYSRAGRFIRYSITDIAKYILENRVKVA